MTSDMRVMLVDPSLFTGPYDGALTQGLIAHRVSPKWATRPLRKGDQAEIQAECVDPYFYRWVDGIEFLPEKLRLALKGVAHIWGLTQLLFKVWTQRPDVVHFQWAVLPKIDAWFIRQVRRWSPVVLTVHDTVPFNGEKISTFHNHGFDQPLRASDRLIVHTQAGRANLVARGLSADKIDVVRHGPLALKVTPPAALSSSFQDGSGRYTLVLFGEIKPYKGVDVILSAIARLSADVRASLRLIVAGRPRMDIEPLQQQATHLQLDGVVEWFPRRLSDDEMADLFAVADALVFPYRQIDASGVYYLTKSLRRWMIASAVGVFKEDMLDGQEGRLVPSEDVAALAAAIEEACRTRPSPDAAGTGGSWSEIGARTRQVYVRAMETWKRDQAEGSQP